MCIAYTHRGRHPAIDRLAAPEWTPRLASRLAAVSGGIGGDGAIPVVRARLCAVADRRARHRGVLEHADDLDSHRSAAGDTIARDGDRDHVHRHRPGWCDDDRHLIGKGRTSGGDPYHGWPGALRTEPSLAKTDQDAGRPITTGLTICEPVGHNPAYHLWQNRTGREQGNASGDRGAL